MLFYCFSVIVLFSFSVEFLIKIIVANDAITIEVKPALIGLTYDLVIGGP